MSDDFVLLVEKVLQVEAHVDVVATEALLKEWIFEKKKAEVILALEDGKANLIAEDFCDGFGECLPACPTGALSLEAKPHTCRS